MRSKSTPSLRGTLHFLRNKVLLRNGEHEYFIRPFSLERGYREGDLVEAKITRPKSEGYLAEVVVLGVIEPTRLPLVGKVHTIKGRKLQIEIYREYGNIGMISIFSEAGKEGVDDIIEVRSDGKKGWMITQVLGHVGDRNIEEMLLFRKEGIRTTFSESVESEAQGIENQKIGIAQKSTLIPTWMTDGLDPLYFDPGMKIFFPTVMATSDRSNSGERVQERTDFRHIFTMTIDGADAKDLDDAISIARYRNGHYLLTVHIADVAEYVREGSALDHEAILRTTSIYTPGRVIPMLPEKLSNDLCSLHPGEAKLTLSILMKVDQRGKVLGTFMTEGVIESRKRGIYEEIQENDERGTMNDENIFPKKDKKLGNGGSGGEIIGRRKENTLSENDYKQQNGESEGATLSEWGGKQKRDERQQSESDFVAPSGAFGTFHSGKVQKDSEDKRFLPAQEGRGGDIPFLDDFFSLFHILERRRKKEGKIIFESSEPTFTFDQEGNMVHVEKRERGASHMMIEEFMVLANEEVAKWCTKYSLPFLSRIHHLPPEENAKIIREIIGLAGSHEKLHPGDIRGFLDRYSLTQMTDNGSSFQDLEARKYLNDEKLGSGGSGGETIGAKKVNTENGGAEQGGASFLPPETFGTFGHESTEMGSGKEQEDSKGMRFLLSPRGSSLDALHQFTLSQEGRDTGSEWSGEGGDMEAGINQEGGDRAGNTYIPSSLYRYSRLLLPKMAKAFYSDKAHMHFGLALEYYSHFTSPIRRYPDLQVHRIIKEQLHGTLDKKRKDHYRQILKKIAKKCSDGEVRATDIERAVDAIVICRYMTDKVGQTFGGRISGLTEWAIFIELESGVEMTSYLPKGRERYTVDPIYGTLSQGKKILHMIGDPVQVKVVAINREEKRVEGEIIN